MTRSDKWRTVLRMVAITAPLGALVGAFPNVVSGDGMRAVVTGGVIGLLITIGMAAFSVSWVVELVPRRWREAPFLVVLVTRSLVWLAIIALGIGLPLMVINRTPLSQLTTGRIGVLVAISFTAALILSFIGQVNRLLGRGVMTRLILGRYHRPREENRIFLLVDLKGSTQIAEQLGNLRYHEFVKRFIGDVAANAVRHGGEVHRYVGDEVIVTWSEQRGLADAACIRAVFAITDALAHARPDYDAEFGIVPEHLGRASHRPSGHRRGGDGQTRDRLPRRRPQHRSPNRGSVQDVPTPLPRIRRRRQRTRASR